MKAFSSLYGLKLYFSLSTSTVCVTCTTPTGHTGGCSEKAEGAEGTESAESAGFFAISWQILRGVSALS